MISTAQIVPSGLADSSNMTDVDKINCASHDAVECINQHQHNHDPHSGRAQFGPNGLALDNGRNNTINPEAQIISRESEQSICMPEFDDFSVNRVIVPMLIK